MSLNDYYQYMALAEGHHEDDGHDHDDEGHMELHSGGAFGFFSIGASLGIPLNVGEEYGEWGARPRRQHDQASAKARTPSTAATAAPR